jgi:mycofactocin precursor
MAETAQDEIVTTDATGAGEDSLVEDFLVEESLVEEVSIDGMCGVY